MGCHFLLQGVFLTQGSDCCLPRLLLFNWILYTEPHEVTRSLAQQHPRNSAMTWEALEAGRSQGLESWAEGVICPQHSPEGLHLFHSWRGEWPGRSQINDRALGGTRAWHSRCLPLMAPSHDILPILTLCAHAASSACTGAWSQAQLRLRAGAWERHRSEAFPTGG